MKRTIRYSYNGRAFQAFLSVWLVVCTAFSLFSLFLTLLNATKTNVEVATSIFAFPHNPIQALQNNFRIAWESIAPQFWRSILYAFVGSVGDCAIGAVLGYVFAYKEFPFKRFLFTLYISVMLLPSIMGMPILVPMMRFQFGLENSIVAFLLPMFAGGQVTALFLFRTFFRQQPKSIYEYARVEGANDLHIFFKITIRLAFPIILYHFIGTFSSLYNDYLWASLIMGVGGGDGLLMPTIQSASNALSSSELGAMYAMYVISSLPLIVTTSISMKFFSSGNFAAGLKL